MSDMPPPPLREPLLDKQGNITPTWALWFQRVSQLIRELTP